MPSVLITGTNRGLGLEFVKQYAADGWQVLACCRNPDDASALNEIARTHSNKIEIFALDTADFSSIERLSAQLANRPIDVLISNAGIFGSEHQGFENTNYDSWHHTFLVNTMASLKIAQCFSNHLSAGTNKCFVAISSKLGSMSDNNSGGYYIYRSSKAALNSLVKSMAVDLRPQGITVIAMHPGWVKTDMGGPNAPLSTSASIAGMRKVISQLKLNDSGKFLGYDGENIGW